MRRRPVLVLAVVLLAACGGDDDTSPAPTSAARAVTAAPTTAPLATEPATTEPATTEPPTTEPPPTEPPTTEPALDPLTILVTNDDGIGATGIDVLVNALSELEAVEVVVVAPAENQSGSSDSTTDGPVTSTPAATAGGTAGVAVAGFPADSVNAALDGIVPDPDLVVSGVNEGQNIGPFVELSGTVGAARTAARRGIPAVAASAGITPTGEPDFEVVAELVVDWIEVHRAAITAGTQPVTVVSFNAPTCPDGTSIRGLVEVPVASAFPEGADPFASDCSSTLTDPADDYTALANGFATLTDVGV